MKKLAILTALLLLSVLLAAGVCAADVVDSGSCGDSLTWTLYDDGLFEITGTGAMDEYGSAEALPWYSYRSRMETLRLNEGLATISAYAFTGCDALTGSLTIPSTVTVIGGTAFNRCTGLTGSLTIPSGVTAIGKYAFYNCTGFTGSLTIPSNVTEIGNYAFANCSGFTGALTLGNGLTEISQGVFSGCSGFTGSLTIPDSVTMIGFRAFCGCSGFTGTLTLGNSVEIIDTEAFSGCSGFTGPLTFPDSVTMIQVYAFRGCSGFSGALTLPEGATVGPEAFSGCSGLLMVTVQPVSKAGLVGKTVTLSAEASGTGVTYQWQYKNKTGATWTNASGKTAVWTLTVAKVHGGFDFRCKMTDAYGNTVTTDSVRVYIGSRSDAEAVFCGECGDDLAWILYDDGLLEITGTGEMRDYRAYGVTHIDSGMSYVTNNTAPWYPYASVVLTLQLDEGITKIGEGAFAGCPLSGTLTLPSTLTAIGKEAFWTCRGLGDSLTIPEGVTSIGTEAFSGCSGITYVFFEGNAPTAGNSIFGTRGSSFYILVRQDRTGWKNPWRGYTINYINDVPELAFTTDPEDRKAVVGARVTMSVGVFGTGEIAYQWQYKEIGSDTWTDADGTSAKTANWVFFVTEEHYGYEYRCVIADTYGNTAASNSARVRPPLTITAQPENQEAVVGTQVTVSVAVSGTGELTYQWQYKKKTDSAWSNAGGASAKTPEWLLTVAAVHYDFDFRCTVSDAYGSTAASYIFHIDPLLCITSQPASVTAVKGTPVTLSVRAFGEGTLTYQWQYKKKTDSAWSNAGAASAKTADWTWNVAAEDYDRDFRCKVTDASGETLFSDTVHIDRPALTITKQPVGVVAVKGTTAVFTVEASGTGALSYQWQYKAKTGTSWSNYSADSAKTAEWTRKVESDDYDRDHRCKVTDVSGTVVYSDVFHIDRPALTITKQPVDAVAGIGESVTFSVEASGTGELTYRWQEKMVLLWYYIDESSAHTPVYTFKSGVLGTDMEYRCVITDPSGSTVYSDVVRVYRSASLEITTQPTDQTAAVGDKVTMSVGASGIGTLTYQWQYKNRSSDTWNNASGKTADWELTVAAVHYGFDFRCKVTDAYGNTAYSKSVRIEPGEVTLEITTQPTDKTAAVGDKVTMTVGASGIGTLTYQWQYKNRSSDTWNNASGKTANWVLTVAAVHYGFDFRCVVTDTYGNTAYSEAVRINPSAETLKITAQPTDKTAAVGDKVTMTVGASGIGTLTYQWQYKNKTASTWNSASGKTANWVLTVAAVHYGFDFRCVVTDTYGNTATSNVVRINPSAETLKITAQPTSKTAGVGDKVTMTIAASGTGTLTYQWQYKNKTASTWNNASGKTANWQLTVAQVHYGFDFRCVVTDAYGNSAISNVVQIDPVPTLTVTTQPTSKTAAVGDKITMTVGASGTGTLTYQWQYKNKSSDAWTNASGTTANWVLTVYAVHYGFDFRCVVTDAYGNTAVSNTVQISRP